MAKYRTIEKNGKFYPQKRICLFFWCYYEEAMNDLFPYAMINVSKNSLEESENFILQQIIKDEKVNSEIKSIKKHKFVK